MSTLALALTFFLVANPLGNFPAIVALLKNFDMEQQHRIILREVLFSFFLAVFFQYFGEYFLELLGINDYALTLTGGTLLFMIATQRIFHKPEGHEGDKLQQEPYIVPIATPLISGPGLMTLIMITSRSESNNLKISAAILLAWIGVLMVLMVAPYLQKLIGKRGLSALEQVMGMILGLMAIQMMINGAKLFAKTLT